jgi:hypothetical protein
VTRSLAVLVLAAAFGLGAQLLFYREAIGLNLLLAVALFLALAWRIRRSPIRMLDAWIPGFALAFAGFAALRADPSLVAFDVAAALALSLATVALLSGVSLSALPLPAFVREGWSLALSTLGAAARPLREEAPRMPVLAGSQTRTTAAYAAGAAMAIPFVVIFGLLFVSADAVFARWAEETLEVDEWARRFGELKDRSVVAVAAAWLAGGALTRLAFAAPSADRGGPSWPRLPIQAATAFLVMIDLLFATFVAFQIAYLFGGRDTVEAAAIPYSEYARRGFFELVTVAVLVAATLFTLELALGRRTRVYVGAGVALIGLTGVILFSSLYRLDLYQRAYGWSELRFYVLAALAFLACALLILAWALVARRMHVALQPIAFAALAVALVVNAVGPSGLIARANIDRAVDLAATEELDALEPAEALERELDRSYLIVLGDGALPRVIAGLERLPATDASCLRMLLLWQSMRRDLDSGPSWQSWNVDRERARQALLSIRDELYALIAYPGDDWAAMPSQRLEQRYQEECTGHGRARARVLSGSSGDGINLMPNGIDLMPKANRA